jgi:4a-hydroxytetrahydrobiopterin dehydratase
MLQGALSPPDDAGHMPILMKCPQHSIAMALSDEICVPCLDGGPTLTAAEVAELLGEITGWEIVGTHHLHKTWSFSDFHSALNWVNRAGAICEAQGHHADFSLGWGYAEAVIYTHKADGLTRSDLVLAAKLDAMDQVWDHA